MTRPPQPTEWIVCVCCQEDDPSVLVACRDGRIRCAHHANAVGLCWDCGEGDASCMRGDPDDETNGMCHDCRAALAADAPPVGG